MIKQGLWFFKIQLFYEWKIIKNGTQTKNSILINDNSKTALHKMTQDFMVIKEIQSIHKHFSISFITYDRYLSYF